MKTTRLLSLLISTSPLLVYSDNPVRPNILWLTFEDTSPQFIGCYGDQHAKTPNMDRLASDGVRFTSAFSTGAVSSPSRFCLFTGVRPTTMGTGHHRSAYPIPDFINGFPYYLKQSGYYTSNNVKTDYNFANAKTATQKAWDESSDTADWRKRKPGQPFFAIYNGIASHQSRTMTNPWNIYEQQVLQYLDESEQTHGVHLEMPLIYRDTPKMQKYFSRVYNSITLTDKEFGKWLQKLEDDGLRDSTIIFCFADHGEGIPRGKGSAVSLGYRVPFIIWFPPMYAHLSPWGTSGVVTDELISFEDMAATVLSLAGADAPDYLEGRPFLGTERKEEKKYVYSAVDRLDGSTDLSRSITDGQFIYTRVFTTYMPFLDWMMYYDVSDIQKQIRSDFYAGKLNKTQRSILLPREAEYLYDIKHDKWEIHNLIHDKKYGDKVNVFRTELRKYLEEKKDAHFIPEYYYLSDKKQIPYFKRLDTTLYPVKEVLDAAYLSGGGVPVVKKQIQLLQDDNPVVRYWAAVGLYGQDKGIKPYRKQLSGILKAMSDEPAKIYLAASLYNSCDDREAKDALLAFTKDENLEMARMALQTCMYLSAERKLDILPVVRELLASYGTGGKYAVLKDYCEMFLYYVDRKGELTYDQWW